MPVWGKGPVPVFFIRVFLGKWGGIPIGTQPSTGEAAEKGICTV